MKQDLSNKRMDYAKNSMDFEKMPATPMLLFDEWYKQAFESQLIKEVYAMSLSTIGRDGFPKNRIVLLKEYNADGFVFYTNYESEKGKAILENPKVCLSFFWDELEQQVIVKGMAEKVSQEMSDAYFHQRPFESQLGAIVSAQSTVIDRSVNLEEQVNALKTIWEGKEIPRPEHWGGFLVKAVEVEFWQGRPSRLHDRLRYQLQDGKWVQDRLSP